MSVVEAWGGDEEAEMRDKEGEKGGEARGRVLVCDCVGVCLCVGVWVAESGMDSQIPIHRTAANRALLIRGSKPITLLAPSYSFRALHFSPSALRD